VGHTWRADPGHRPAGSPFPRAAAMAVLLAVATGRALEVGEFRGEDVIAFPDPTDPAAAVLVDGADLDTLEGLGWLAIGEKGAAVTDRGRYWLKKWLNLNRKALRIPKGTQPEELFVRGEAGGGR
jgi:hypothetical protein